MLTGYKTILVAALVTVVGALQSLDWVNLLPNNATTTGYVVTALGLVMAVLRWFTNTSIGNK